MIQVDPKQTKKKLEMSQRKTKANPDWQIFFLFHF